MLGYIRGCVRNDQESVLGVIDQEGGRECDLGPHRLRSRGCVRVDQKGVLGVLGMIKREGV